MKGPHSSLIHLSMQMQTDYLQNTNICSEFLTEWNSCSWYVYTKHVS